MAAGSTTNTIDGLTEIISEGDFGRVAVNDEIVGENDNNGVRSGIRRVNSDVGVDSIAYIDLNNEITPAVEALLRKTLSHCEDSKAGIADEKTLRVYLGQYRQRFDSIFDNTEYVHDLRVAKMVRVFDYCYRVGFDCQDFFDVKLNREISPEEAISTFRNFFRMATIMVTEQIDRPEIIKQLKISGVKNPRDSMFAAAQDLASSIRNATKERLDEIYAALVMLKSGIID